MRASVGSGGGGTPGGFGMVRLRDCCVLVPQSPRSTMIACGHGQAIWSTWLQPARRVRDTLAQLYTYPI